MKGYIKKDRLDEVKVKTNSKHMGTCLSLQVVENEYYFFIGIIIIFKICTYV